VVRRRPRLHLLLRSRRPWQAVLCFAHVTNQMALTNGDFEKGEDNGARDALRLIDALVGVIDRLSPPLT